MALVSFVSGESNQAWAFSLLSKAITTKRSGGIPSSATVVVVRMT
jgi:hypothetical protein